MFGWMVIVGLIVMVKFVVYWLVALLACAVVAAGVFGLVCCVVG